MSSSAPEQPPRQGRRRDATATRARILSAATARFAESTFGEVTVRDIAADADIDPALIVRYFGNKHQLYLEALTPTLRLDDLPDDDIVGSFTEGLLDRLDHEGRRLFAIAATEPEDSPTHLTLRQLLDAQLIGPLAQQLAAESGHGIEAVRLRTELAVGIVAGIAFLRSVLGTPALAALSTADLVSALRPLVQAAFERRGRTGEA